MQALEPNPPRPRPPRTPNPFHPRVTLERIGHLVSRTILTGIYGLLVGPIGVFFRHFADPLRLRRPANSTWSPWPSRNTSLDRAREQE